MMGSYHLLIFVLCFGYLPFLCNGDEEIFPIRGCLLRFQTPRVPGQYYEDSQITQLNWDQTPDQVATTINDFDNINGRNIPLWLSGETALLYAGFMTSSCIPMEPQRGLNHPTTAVSIILPSGVAKLQRIGPTPGEVSDVNLRRTSGIQGIRGQLVPEDYAYASGASIRAAIAFWENLKRTERRWARLGEIYFHAVQGGTRTPVIIQVPII